MIQNEWIKTEDGSLTLKSSDYGETYHSRSGAWLETQTVYLRPFLERSKLSKKQNWSVLDVGFGLGYNWLCYVNAFLHRVTPLFDHEEEMLNTIKNKIEILSLENDAQVLDVKLGPECLGCFPARQEAFDLLDRLKAEKQIETDYVEAEISLGQAKESLKKAIGLGRKFDVVLQDPFSPRVNPECWDSEYFQMIKDLSHPETVVLSYSVARTVCDALSDNGFEVEKSPGFGSKRNQLFAVFKG